MPRKTRPVIVSKNAPVREDRSWDVLNCLNAIERSVSRLETLINGDIERRGWEAMGHAYNEFINIRSVAECNELADKLESDRSAYAERERIENLPLILSTMQELDKNGFDGDVIIGAISHKFRLRQTECYLHYRNMLDGNLDAFNPHNPFKVSTSKKLSATIEAISLADKLMDILKDYSSGQWERPSVHMYADDSPHRETLIFLLSSYVACGKSQAGLFSHIRDLTNGKADVRHIDTAVQGIADHFDRHITKIMQAGYEKDRGNRIPAIKVLRTVFGTGLRETKEMVDKFWQTKITSEA